MIIGLAPMDGVTDYIYRRIVQDIVNRHGDKKHTLRKRTEFMSADGYMINPSRLVKHLVTCQDEHHLIAQIYGWNKDTLLKTAQDIERKYPFFTGIELNIWCPSPKILACGAGAGMMRNKAKTLEYIKEISEWITLPFSIKTRIGLHPDDRQEQFDFILAAAQYCPTITIHGRYYNQAHNGTVDRDFIYNIKKQLWTNNIIIGNGGIQHYDDILQHDWHIDGVMIGQAAMQNPRIFTTHKPNTQEKLELSLHHLLLLWAYEIYINHRRKEYPEESDQLIINRQYLHLNKKYNPDSDELIELPKIDFHDYIFPFPSYQQIDEIYVLLKTSIEWGNTTINWKGKEHNIISLRCAIDFRKYFFGYIKGASFTKEIKQQAINSKDIPTLYHIIKSYHS